MTVRSHDEAALRAKGNKGSGARPYRRATETGVAVMTLVLVPLLAVILAVAGALTMALVFSLLTMNLDALERAAGVLIKGVFFDGLIGGLAAGVLGTAVSLLVDRSQVVIAAFGLGSLVFFCYALFAIFNAALTASPWGSTIGAAIGLPLGILAGRRMARDNRATAHRQQKSAAAGDDLDFWRADDGDDDGGD